ncbi:angiotensin-converting enzyme 2 [Melanerpes formicivorus]|uniref:angiotensin-converting enzyme 2 n=1 Tax=Melanerpes formicivorus TaxID=211600 RepID=UPI00358E1137
MAACIFVLAARKELQSSQPLFTEGFLKGSNRFPKPSAAAAAAAGGGTSFPGPQLPVRAQDAPYEWDGNELFLFKSTIAYAMRKYFAEVKDQEVDFQVADIHVGQETQRISFYLTVSMPGNISDIVPKAEVEDAIRRSRGRINEAFRLDDYSLEFEGIPPTLATPYEPPVTIWLIVFGVVISLVVIGVVVLIITGQRDRRRRARESRTEAGAGRREVNPYEDVGEINPGFHTADETQTAF